MGKQTKFCRNSKSLNIGAQVPPAVPAGPEGLCWKVPYDSPIEALVAASSYLRDRNAEASCFMPYECPTCGKIHLTKGRLEILFDILY